jgi:hypothetical protein
MTTKILNRRQARWAEILAGYDFVLIHTPGPKNPADGRPAVRTTPKISIFLPEYWSLKRPYVFSLRI